MKHILIVEDDLDMREALEATFQSKGYEVTAIPTAEEAINTLSTTALTPDLILLDVMTGSLHASGFLKRLRELPAPKGACHVIVVTNLDTQITRDQVAAYGIDDYVVKIHTSLETLVKKVETILSA
jgi:DNA-binding response OmpR family regulator